MAEALVEIVLEQFVSIIRQQAEEGISLIAGAEREVEKLQSNFLSIQAVLPDAENRQVMENAVRVWLDQLKDASYDIDDVLDEWNTKLQKLKIKKAEDASNPLKKVRSSILLYLSCRPSVLHHHIAIKIKDLDRQLDIIARQKEMFHFRSITQGNKETEWPMKTSIVNLQEVYGRDDDKNTIIDFLLSHSSHAQDLHIISIVGMGGIGKTTLAQLVFNDKQVLTHFDKIMWVHVSKPLDELRIATAILKSLTNSLSQLVELEKILTEIQRHIERKKFLLVLDDVWTEDPKDWENLKHTLKYGSLESRILVTTRNKNVANAIGTTNIISLGILPEEECWSLFCQIAYSGKITREFKEIGKKIVKKCTGLPLVVKILGNLLRVRDEFKEWECLLNSEMWEFMLEQEIFPYLLLTYQDLPPMLKKCFLYCAIFPKDYKITKDKMIKLWMAQGYLKGQGRVDEVLIGEECFENLEMFYFFQEFERSEYDGSIISWKMHNIIHDLARFLVKNEFCTREFDGLAKSQLELYYKEARHLMIIGNPTSIDVNNEKLRSLIVERTASDFKIEVDLSELFDKLICIRTLGLSSCSLEEIPEGIKKLISLRYLNLSHNVKLEKLPETLCELYNLETVDVTNCFRLQKLPHGLGKLSNLRHLRNHGTSLSYMPRGIEKLTHLRELSKFVVSNVSDANKACSLSLLKKLNGLIGFLLITGLGNVSEVDEVKKAKLEDKTNLSGLGLRFDGWMYAEDEAIFKDLLPPPNLQELMIQYYTGKTMPLEWILSLTKLRVLKLSSCFEFKYLPALGKLSTLESLMIWNMTSVKKVGNEFLIESGNRSSSSSSPSVFPKLKYLAMWNMEEWEEWEESDFDVTIIMPCLHSLKLSSCPKLKSLPEYIIRPTPRLEKLEIENCGILKQRYNKKTGQDFSKVSHIPGFVVMDDSMISTSLVNVDPETDPPIMESRIQDKGKGKMPIDFSITMSSDPRTSDSE